MDMTEAVAALAEVAQARDSVLADEADVCVYDVDGYLDTVWVKTLHQTDD